MGIFRQFPYSNFHEMNMDEIIKIMRELQDEWNATKDEWSSYKDFIDNYFETLNLDEETEKALRKLINEGALNDVIDPVIIAQTTAWLTEHITPTTPAIDTSLTISGAGADAKIVGERFTFDETLIDMVANSNYDPEYIAIEQGRRNATGEKDNTSYNWRCRTTNEHACEDYDIIIVNHDKPYGMYIDYYDSAHQFLTKTGMVGRDDNVIINKQYKYFTVTFIDYSNNSYENIITPAICEKNFIFCKFSKAAKYPYYLSEVVTKHGVTPIETNFVNGRIEANGTDSNNPYFSRVRTSDYYSTENVDYIVNSKKHNYLVYQYFYDANKNFTTSLASTNAELVNIDKTYPFIRIAVLNYDNSSYDNQIDPFEAKENITFAKSSTLSNIINDESLYPRYYNSHIAAVKNAINEHKGLIGKNGCSFVFCTDIHWGSNQKNSPALIKDIANNCFLDNVVLGGDYINQYNNDKAGAIYWIRQCMKNYRNIADYVFPIFGNHDINSNGTTSESYLTDAETYSLINSWISNEVQYGTNYFDFYWDDEKTNTRFIMLDTGAQSVDGGIISENTFTWLNDVLNTTKNIVVFAHWLYSPTTWNHPLVDGVLTGSFTSSANRLFNILDTLNTNNGKVQAIITGHLHCDYHLETPGGIPIIWTDTDSTLALGDNTATAGTITEQCFDVMTIDYTNHRIYCDRVGRGSSRIINY